MLSFLALGALWRTPQLERRAAGRPLPVWLERVLRSTALHVLLGAVSAGLLLLVFATALVGEPSSAVNLAPTFIYVIFWLGLVPVQVLLGNVWPVLNPWLAFANATSWVSERLGRRWTPPLAYPERLGVWPGAVLLFCFAALELTYAEPASPRALALAVALYSYMTWFGMAAFGRRAWVERGEAFTVYFGLLALIAPFGERDGRLDRPDAVLGPLRPGTTGRACSRSSPSCSAPPASTGSAARRSGRTCARTSRGRTSSTRPEPPSSSRRRLRSRGCSGASLSWRSRFSRRPMRPGCSSTATIGSSRSSCAASCRSPSSTSSRTTSRSYWSIASTRLRLASDPFGYGWDLFGTAELAPNIAPLSPNAVWYVQVGALVAGHVAGLTVAHDRAVTILPARDALRSQYAMLALMVVYTVGGLWLLSR